MLINKSYFRLQTYFKKIKFTSVHYKNEVFLTVKNLLTVKKSFRFNYQFLIHSGMTIRNSEYFGL